MTKRARKIMASAAVVAGMAGALGAAAMAAPGAAFAGQGSGTSSTGAGGQSGSGSTLAAIQARAATAVAARQTALSNAVSAVGSNRFLTSGDQSTLLNTLNNDLSAMEQLGPKIAGDTTVSAAQADYRSIFTDYRVFALALPQVRFAESADDLTGTVLPHLEDAQSKLQALLSGPDSSKNSSAVQGAMADLGQQITAISSATNGLSATILAFTPPQWDANPQILTPAHESLVNARTAAHQARQDVETVVEDLKS